MQTVNSEQTHGVGKRQIAECDTEPHIVDIGQIVGKFCSLQGSSVQGSERQGAGRQMVKREAGNISSQMGVRYHKR